MKLKTLLTVAGIVLLITIVIVLIISSISGETNIQPDPDKEVAGYDLLIRAIQGVPTVSNIATRLYTSVNSDDIERLFADYKFSKDIQKKLTKQFKGAVFKEVERAEIYETGYYIDIEKEEIRYNMEINFYEGNENKGNYNVFIVVDKDNTVVKVQGY